MNIAVCDDQLEELKAVESLLRAWQEQQCAAIRLHLFHNAGELLEAARKERFTLYLLDVMMPGTSGMAAAREIRTFDSAADIVFLTSSPGFAYESYGVQALEYLLKPITAKKLFPLLSRLYLREQKPQEALTLKSNGTFIRVPFSELSLPVGSAFCHTAHSFCSNTRYCRRRKIAGKTGQSYQNNNKQPHQHASAMFCLGLSRNQRMYCRKTTKHRMVRSRPVMDILLALGRALHCLRKQWPYLICFLEDGRLNRATTGRSAV